VSAAKELVAEAFELRCEEIPDDASIENFEAWDSLGHMRIVAAIEARLGRALETEEVLAAVDLAAIGRLIGQ